MTKPYNTIAFGAAALIVGCAAPVPLAAGAGTSSSNAEPSANGSPAPASAEPDPTRARLASPEPTPEPAAERPPPTAARFFALEVPGFAPAVVAAPEPAAGPLPLVVAAHGAGDTPESQCEVWSELVRLRAVVLCPRGKPIGRGGQNGYFYANHHELERELVAALAALRAQFGERIAAGPGIYAGYSQGATMGALMILKHGAEFPRLALIEGGFDVWSIGRAKAYRAAGGRRVLIACGTGHCRKHADASARWLTASGVEARSEHVAGGGHAYWGRVAERVQNALPWLLEGDERWASR